MGVECVLGFIFWMELEQESRKVSILAKMKQILHMESIDSNNRVGLNDLAAHEERLASLSSSYPIHCEATR